jgi:hypothetical protein
MGRSQSDGPSKASGSGRHGLGPRGVHGRSHARETGGSRQAHPLGVQCGLGLNRAAPLGMQQASPITSHFALEHRRDGSCQVMRQEAQGFAWVMVVLQAGQRCRAGLVGAQAPRGGFRNGPVEMGVADVVARRAHTLAAGFLPAWAQTAIGGQRLHAGQAVDAEELGEPHEAEPLAHTGHREEEREGGGIVVRGRVQAREGEGSEPLILIGHAGQGALDGFWPRRLGQACAAPPSRLAL